MNWHHRYLVQAGWTRELRTYLFQKAGFSSARRVLEVGCGTGAILCDESQDHSKLNSDTGRYGIDRSAATLDECRIHAPGAFLTRGDAVNLPYADNSFDITYCHYLLLWVNDPFSTLIEMKRVTKLKGYIIALAEPDYISRVDQPEEISWLGKRQTQSLMEQGADVRIGSRVADLFYEAGINILETGIIKNRNKEALTSEEWENEWAVLIADLAGIIAKEEMQEMKHLDEQAWRHGEHEMYIPTYFAWGQV